MLEALESAGGPASLSQIATLTAMPSSKVHRYLVSLVRSGMVRQSRQTGLYDFGPAARRLGAEAIRRLDEGSLAAPHAVALRDLLGHTVNLAAWGETGPAVIGWEYGKFPIHVTVRPGGKLPLWSSSGRVFLAFLPEAVTRPVFEAQVGVGMPAGAEFSTLADELATIRASRVSFVSDTPVLGIDGFASPVFDASGQIVLTIGVVAPRALMTPELRRSIADALVASASAISAELGWQPEARAV